MPAGNVVVFGYEYNKFNIIEKALNINLDFKNSKVADSIVWGGGLPDFRESLKKAHTAACLDMGFDLVEDDYSYPVWNTPEGDRKMSSFSLNPFWDPDEIGDSLEDAVIGVAVISRYFPTFIDWRYAHGGSNRPRLSHPETDIARKHIVAALPWMSEAEFITILRWF